MRRAVLTYVLLLLAPSGALALFAFRAADADHAERVEGHRLELEDAAGGLGRKVEEAIAAGLRAAEGSQVFGLARDGRWIGYSAGGAAVPPEPPEPEDERLYRLSAEGGEDFEHARKDPDRALDAYTFHLPRIRSPLLRARLELRAARALLSAPGAGRNVLAAAILRRLFERGEGLETEEGLPIDLLAASRLLPAGAEAVPGLADAARLRLLEAAPRLPTATLARLVLTIAPGDGSLRDLIDDRRALEAAVARHPGALSSTDAVLADSHLLLAGQVEGAPRLRAIRLAKLDLPALDVPGLAARLDGPSAAGPAPGAGRAEAPVRLGEGGPAVAMVRIEDPAFPARLAVLERRRLAQKALVGLLVLATLGGGLALAVYIGKERRLARLRARLLANVSHELKTPVTSIRMFAEMLAEDPVSDEQVRTFAGHLQAESHRLSHLVADLLDLSRPRRDEGDIPREPVDLAPLLSRIAGSFAYRAREDGVAFHAEGWTDRPANGAPLILATNPAALERIVLNLLDNALKYRRKDGPSITLRLERAEGVLRVAVADNGRGIRRGEEERVFEEFYRAEYDDYAVQGTGLGLAISRRLARKLGGDVRLESREGGGSTFMLELPWQEGNESSAHPGR